MKLYLTPEILTVLNTVYHYKRYKRGLCELHKDYLLSDWYTDTEMFYYELPLPAGLLKNHNDFETVMQFDPIIEPYKTWNNIEEEELRKIVWKTV